MKIPKPSKQLAKVEGSAMRTNRTSGQVEKKQDYSGVQPIDVPPGESTVAATRGFKHWFSTRDAGMTVESTTSVTISCERDLDSIMNAGWAAGQMAERLAKDGCNDMDLYIEKFMRETES